jgi:hypothetical protein
VGEPRRPARLGFWDDTHAAEHLCDHVLTRPEAHDWALLLPAYRDHVDPTDDNALRATAASLFAGAPLPAAEALLRAYIAAGLRAVDDALGLGLWWEQRVGGDRYFVGMGLDGVLVFWDAAVLRSAYVPRFSTLPPDGPTPSRTVNPLPRRDPARRLGAPPPDTPRARYDVFQATHFSASRLYELAYNNQEVQAAGGTAFVTRCPRFGRWQQLIAARPAGGAANERGEDETTGGEPA